MPYLRMMMLFVEEAAGISYTATLVLSGDVAATKPSGSANTMPTFAKETFGGEHTGKVQERPSRATAVPSGQTLVSSGHAIGSEERSTAFL
jgi:hypothetical protein